ncbi:MAG: hypothetical protein JSR61_02670 [Proteobacteria bacterium]|nr:hypothetical protein [Pseudomonadota bacterium]
MRLTIKEMEARDGATAAAFKSAAKAGGSVDADAAALAEAIKQGQGAAFGLLMTKIMNLTFALEAGAAERRRLELRVAELEERPDIEYRGVFEPGATYQRGHFATDDGSVWFCNRETKTRPSEGGSNWTLAVKRGRDGKDARAAAPRA